MSFEEPRLNDGPDAATPVSRSVEPAQKAPANARSIQITIAIGLVLAIIVAVFGRY